ncbi:MAG: pyruvate, phosphate dikinase, partial [Sphingomonadales bacterium]
MSIGWQKSSKWVFSFSQGKAEGNALEKDSLGGKGANLAEMCNLGLPVPPGFTISTHVCEYYNANQGHYPEYLKPQIKDAMSALEATMASKFGDQNNPLLVSVRSGASVSMPGMMDTVLNLGLNDKTVLGLAKRSGDERFAYDSYRRFIQMYGDVVMGVPHNLFEKALKEKKNKFGAKEDSQISAAQWQDIIKDYRDLIITATGKDFPQDALSQLWGGIDAVFGSWMGRRAITYRHLHGISDELGTAVNVQSMVFGNRGKTSATGVLFTRSPVDGARKLYGEYLINAQGEDVVSGMRTPENIADVKNGQPVINQHIPEIYGQILETANKLESHYRDMQDVEFTVEGGKLWLLQTRAGNRTIAAAIQVAVDMCEEGLITKEEALQRIDPKSLDQLLHPTIDYKTNHKALTTGLPASPGAATGVIVFSPDEAETRAEKGEDVILVREATSPEDIHGMHSARGILTASGGMTSHAAVVARGMGRPCVCGASEMVVKESKNFFRIGDATFKVGDMITIDGTTGNVFAGTIDMVQPKLTKAFDKFLKWADQLSTLAVRANADTPEDCKTSLKFKARGIGLCRTEHMFFAPERLSLMRQMILAETATDRLEAIKKIQPIQHQDFKEIFEIMAGYPITIRLLDPPLHEFLPRNKNEIEKVSKESGLSVAIIKHRIAQLHEENPMLGHRGCRLGISYPEIYEMQVKAMLEAALEIAAKKVKAPLLEIMVPFVANVSEIAFWRERIEKVAIETLKGKAKVNYQIGTMIELPRACITAYEIAPEVDFFSFGTNDLTQTTIGLSRDDTSEMLSDYLTSGLISK